MTISNTTVRKAGPAQGNGATTVFPFTFKVFLTTELIVTFTNVSGAESLLVMGTDYTVGINADQNVSPGGTITMLVAPVTATYITITSAITNTQNLTLTNAGGFYPSSINDALDRTVILVQQLAEQVSRSLLSPVSSALTVTQWFAQQIANAGGVVFPITLAQGGTGSISASAARTALDVYSTGQVTSAVVTNAAKSCSAGGTADAITGVYSPVITALTNGMVLYVRAASANATTTPTFTPNSGVIAAKTIVKGNGVALVAGDIAGAGHWLEMNYDLSLDQWVLSNPANSVNAVVVKQIQSITSSVASNALTVGLNATSLDFRSATLTNGVPNTRTTAALSLVVPSTATLGTSANTAARLILIALDNSGTVELAIVNIAGGNNLDETTLISTTAMSAAATSASVIYSTTARTSVPFRVVGYLDITETVAGTWAADATTKQGLGGQALAAMSSIGYGQTYQDVTGSRALGTTYFNTTGKPIFVIGYNTNSSAGRHKITLDGIDTQFYTGATGAFDMPFTFMVKANGSYAVIMTGTASLTKWVELR